MHATLNQPKNCITSTISKKRRKKKRNNATVTPLSVQIRSTQEPCSREKSSGATKEKEKGRLKTRSHRSIGGEQRNSFGQKKHFNQRLSEHENENPTTRLNFFSLKENREPTQKSCSRTGKIPAHLLFFSGHIAPPRKNTVTGGWVKNG